jgi:spore germination protein YaaH
VWYEDTRSVRAKLALVSEYGLGGAFFWRLGGEDSNIWPTVREVLR